MFRLTNSGLKQVGLAAVPGECCVFKVYPPVGVAGHRGENRMKLAQLATRYAQTCVSFFETVTKPVLILHE